MNEPGRFKIAVRSAAVWLLIIGAETVNGILRELVVTPRIGDVAARRVSFVIALLIITVISLFTIRRIGVRQTIDLLGVGGLWSLLTVCFEMFIIRPLVGISWERFFADYDPSQGGLMIFGIIFLFFLPLFSYLSRSIFKPRLIAG